MKFNIMRGCAPQGKNFQPFFCNFFFKSTGEKICIIFTNWGKNICFMSHLQKSLLFYLWKKFLQVGIFLVVYSQGTPCSSIIGKKGQQGHLKVFNSALDFYYLFYSIDVFLSCSRRTPRMRNPQRTIASWTSWTQRRNVLLLKAAICCLVKPLN